MAEQRRLTGYRRSNGSRRHPQPRRDPPGGRPVQRRRRGGRRTIVQGTLALPHAFGRLQFGEDLDLTSVRSSASARNPNVAAVVVIGIEPNWTSRVVEGIAKTGKPVEGFSIEGLGDLKVIGGPSLAREELPAGRQRARARAGRALRHHAHHQGRRVRHHHRTRLLPHHGLPERPAGSTPGGTVIFGETSELTGGEHLIAERCIDDEVRAQVPGASTTTTSR